MQVLLPCVVCCWGGRRDPDTFTQMMVQLIILERLVLGKQIRCVVADVYAMIHLIKTRRLGLKK